MPADVPAGAPRPFTLAVDDAALSATLATALFKPSADGADASAARAGDADVRVPGRARACGAQGRSRFDPAQPYVVDVHGDA